MFPELTVLRVVLSLLHDQLSRVRDTDGTPDGGYSTEAIIVTALLVAVAISAVAIIATKVLAKANSISTG